MKWKIFKMLKAGLVLFMLILLTPLLVYANRNNAEEDIIPSYVVAEEMAIYKIPNTRHPIIGRLEAGAEIPLPEFLKTGRITPPEWHTISMLQDGVWRNGYVYHNWGNPQWLTIKYGDIFFTCTTGYDDDGQGMATIEAKKGDDVIASSTIYSSWAIMDNPVLRIIKGENLKDVPIVFTVILASDSCYPMQQMYWAWNGQELVPLPDTKNSFGYEISLYSETLLFPIDGVPGNTIMRIIDFSEYLENGEYTPSDYEIQMYRWDGERAVLMEQKKLFQEWKDFK